MSKNKPGLAIAKDGCIVALEHVFGDRQRDAFKHLGLFGRRVENAARKREGVAVLAIVNVARVRVLCARNGSRNSGGARAKFGSVKKKIHGFAKTKSATNLGNKKLDLLVEVIERERRRGESLARPQAPIRDNVSRVRHVAVGVQ